MYVLISYLDKIMPKLMTELVYKIIFCGFCVFLICDLLFDQRSNYFSTKYISLFYSLIKIIEFCIFVCLYIIFFHLFSTITQDTLINDLTLILSKNLLMDNINVVLLIIIIVHLCCMLTSLWYVEIPSVSLIFGMSTSL